MASNTYRSDPHRAAELAAVLTAYLCTELRLQPAPHKVAKVVCAMQKAARSAKRQAEHACNYGYRDDAHMARTMRRQDRTQARLNIALLDLAEGGAHSTVEPYAPTVELGGDPRGPCARLHIPGQRGDGWGDGWAIY